MFAIKKINITNFKKIKDIEMIFSNGINIIYGPNASGKTTITEAVANLLITKSFKGVKDRELVNFKEKYYSIVGEFDVDGKKTKIITSYHNNSKTIKEDEYIYKKASEYIGKYTVVVFEPGDLELISGTPKQKRRFLDMNISQSNRNYIEFLNKYNKLVKKRNEFLKIEETNEIDEDYLNVLDKEILKCGKFIIEQRRDFIKKINIHIKHLSKLVSNQKETVKIEYIPSSKAKEYQEKYIKSKIIDKMTKNTCVGPHRDTFDVYINDKKADIYASRGQNRTAAIAMKLACGHFFLSLSKKTIFIMDDLFGELDIERQERLIKVLNKNNQIFITTTSLEGISKEIMKDVHLISLKGDENER